MVNEQNQPRDETSADSQEISVTDARAGQRVGLIWVLVISLGLAATGLLGYSTLNSRHMSTAGDASPETQAVQSSAAPPSAETTPTAR